MLKVDCPSTQVMAKPAHTKLDPTRSFAAFQGSSVLQSPNVAPRRMIIPAGSIVMSGLSSLLT